MSMPKNSRSYKDELYESLQDDSEALVYLQVAIEESIPDFLKALRHVAEARQVSTIAAKSRLNRENLYRILSEGGNPRLNSLTAILEALGLRLSIEPIAVSIKASIDELHDEMYGKPAAVIPFPRKVGGGAFRSTPELIYSRPEEPLEISA
jgi:probable addiction module antidote protein